MYAIALINYVGACTCHRGEDLTRYIMSMVVDCTGWRLNATTDQSMTHTYAVGIQMYVPMLY